MAGQGSMRSAYHTMASAIGKCGGAHHFWLVDGYGYGVGRALRLDTSLTHATVRSANWPDGRLGGWVDLEYDSDR